MIKRIIFDLDNTLIEWKDEYWDGVEEALKSEYIKYTKQDIKDIENAIDRYETEYNTYTKENMLEWINKSVNIKVNMRFLEKCLEHFSNCIPNKIDKDIYETLEYLSKKYELVVLTNWFEKQQAKRLETVGILKYFSKVYAPETFLIKPNKEAFMKACQNKPEEVVMVGDSLKADIEGAINAGLKAIYINKNAEKGSKDYITINEFSELKNVL